MATMVGYRPALVVTDGLVNVDLGEANALLEEWGHYLGPMDRPFGSDAWVFQVDGEPLSVAVSASTASSTVAGLSRFEVVELARLCSAPDARWATRPMLRLWREVCAHRWVAKYPEHWSRLAAAVAYSKNDRHEGRIYRFDGWTKVRDDAGTSGGGGGWSKSRQPGDPTAGPKTLWTWRYPCPS